MTMTHQAEVGFLQHRRKLLDDQIIHVVVLSILWIGSIQVKASTWIVSDTDGVITSFTMG